VSKPKNVKKSLIISPILHHSQTVEDCLRRKKRKIGSLKKKKNVHNSFNFVFLPQPCNQLATLEKKDNSGCSVIWQSAKRH
jgi:hypothetical protein